MNDLTNFEEVYLEDLEEPSKLEPSKLEPSKLEPSQIEPSQIEPSQIEPSQIEPEVRTISINTNKQKNEDEELKNNIVNKYKNINEKSSKYSFFD